MSIAVPFRRTIRINKNGSYAGSGVSRYIKHPGFAQSPEHYVRAFLLLQKDLQELFDYVEPADQNLQCYSYRIHELLVRACVEVEANFKAILSENGFSATRMNIETFFKVEASHQLSAYEVRVPVWSGASAVRKPFANWIGKQIWQGGMAPQWYEAYNQTKHDRHNQFSNATFGNLIDAFSACLVLLSSQFYTESFGPGADYLAVESSNVDGMECGIGGYFMVKFPVHWKPEEQYSFVYSDIEGWWTQPDPFAKFPY